MTAVDTRIARITTSAIIITLRLEQHPYPLGSESRGNLRVSASGFFAKEARYVVHGTTPMTRRTFFSFIPET